MVVGRLETLDGPDPVRVPGGLVEHWVGTVFLPGVPLDRLIGFLQDYAAYPTIFRPTIERVRIVRAHDDHFEVAMRTTTHKILTVVLDADYAIDYERLGSSRAWARSVAENIREIEDVGTAEERARPADEGAGYLWRLNTYCAFERVAEGSYEQCESVSLSRTPPFGLGWLAGPIAQTVPRETLAFTLGHVRAALLAH